MEQINENRYQRSRDLFERALKVIPSGIPGHLGPVESQFIPVEAYPFYVDRVKDSYFWDVDGNKFIDYMCAYGPNILGYNNAIVDAAARAQAEKGNCMPMVGDVQVELAELLVDTIDIADWAFFAKNGGDVTSLAIMTARAHTGKTKALMFKGGYHGVAPWTQKSGRAGITDQDIENNLYAKWNDLDGVTRLINEQKNDIACLIATPYHHPVFERNEMPAEGFWTAVQKLCNDNNIILIIDDVRVGFRLDMRGSAAYFGFEPDLACYCKALANGYPISTLVGSNKMRSAVTDVFYTGSYWSSAVPMAAAIACINELKAQNGPEKLLKLGQKLTDGLVQAAAGNSITLDISGATSMFYMEVPTDNTLRVMQTFTAECAKRGVFFTSHHNHFINCSLTEDDITQTLSVAYEAFEIAAQTHPGLVGA